MAAAAFFKLMVELVLETLFGIEVTRSRIRREVGVLGEIESYIGVVEAQGRGTLHLHILIWLKHSPSAAEMKDLLKTEEFREKVREYIQSTIHAHVDGLTKETVKTMPKESELAYSRPPHPDDPEFEKKYEEMERKLARSQQVHTCKKTTCLRRPKGGGPLKCKRRAPWELSETDGIDEGGAWRPKRTFEYLNNWNPDLLVFGRCNNDAKLLTNGEDTKDIAWYTSKYAAKDQSPTHNMSALLARGMAFHQSKSQHMDDMRDKNRLMILRCFQAVNRDMEFSAPQVISYLMGWGDLFTSHRYRPLYWSSVSGALRREFPDLRRSLREE